MNHKLVVRSIAHRDLAQLGIVEAVREEVGDGLVQAEVTTFSLDVDGVGIYEPRLEDCSRHWLKPLVYPLVQFDLAVQGIEDVGDDSLFSQGGGWDENGSQRRKRLPDTGCPHCWGVLQEVVTASSRPKEVKWQLRINQISVASELHQAGRKHIPFCPILWNDSHLTDSPSMWEK
jgi:hypothetical protein